MPKKPTAKPVTTITFQDEGQDFTEWDIVGGEVIESRPFQTFVWAGVKVPLNMVTVGQRLPVILKDGTKTFMNHVVEKVESRTVKQWNPRFAAYAISQGMTPDELLAKDAINYPGGKMAGFIIWSTEQLNVFRKEHPEAFLHGSLVDHTGYDAWLLKSAEGVVHGQKESP